VEIVELADFIYANVLEAFSIPHERRSNESRINLCKEGKIEAIL